MIIAGGGERGLDRRQQNVVLIRLLQEIEGAGFHGENGCLDVSLPGEEDDRWNESNGPEPRLHLQSADAGHLDVQENAAARKMLRLEQKGARGRIGNGGESHRSQESLERETHSRIVVDDMDRPLSWHRDLSQARPPGE